MFGLIFENGLKQISVVFHCTGKGNYICWESKYGALAEERFWE